MDLKQIKRTTYIPNVRIHDINNIKAVHALGLKCILTTSLNINFEYYQVCQSRLTKSRSKSTVYITPPESPGEPSLLLLSLAESLGATSGFNL